MNVGKEPVFVLDIKGGVGKAWDKNRLLRKEDPAISATIAGGSAVTAGKDDDFAFAATKR